MFNFLRKNNQSKEESNNSHSLVAVADGDIISITKVPDQVFSQKILGDGYAIIPSGGSICSPANGTVTEVSDTLHAYCITSKDGLEILVHIGIDTVELKGDGFSPLVKKGDKVSCGSPIAAADLKLIKERGYNTEIMVVITNTDAVKSFDLTEKANVRAGDVALTYKL